MSAQPGLLDGGQFSEALYTAMVRLDSGIAELEPYEFKYCLDNLTPEREDWSGIALDPKEGIERQVNSLGFYSAIQLRPRSEGRIVLDERIVRLTRMLFVGLVTGDYPVEWVRTHFSFDVRGFHFLHRTVYFTERVVEHLGGRPFLSFEPKQARMESALEIGYKQFREANAEVDQAFVSCVRRLVARQGTPAVVAIAGPTAAGKTEIVARLRRAFEQEGKSVASIEMDNFLTDRDQREERGIGSLGKEAIHFELFVQALEDARRGRRVSIPRYDFVYATSSHDLDGTLKPGGRPLVIEPGDIVFVEGNFPFLLEEIAAQIGIKAVYLTDDAIRLKRKWRRDIDYRKKYEPTYFRNRFFKDQFPMAQRCYIPQMEVCDLVVDTTGARLWATPAVVATLGATRPT